MRLQINKDGSIAIFDFSPVQAYKIAVRLEEDGIRFYTELKKDLKEDTVRREVDFLIEEEKRHLKTFQVALAREKEAVGDDFEEDDIVAYLDSSIFDPSRKKEDAGKVQHRHTAWEEAMDMERRSIAFYEGLISSSVSPEAERSFCRILQEEEEHLKKFSGLLRAKCIDSGEGCLL